MGISARLWFSALPHPAAHGIGANFIHGTDGNPLTDVAKKVNSTFVFSLNLRKYYDCDGKPVDEETSSIVLGKVWGYHEAALDYSRENVVDKDADVKSFCDERLKRDKDIKGEKMRDLVEAGVGILSGIAACDLDKLSLKYYWMEDDLPVTPCPCTVSDGREPGHSWIQRTIR